MKLWGKTSEAFMTNSDDGYTDPRTELMDEQEIQLSNNILDWYRSGWFDKQNRDLFTLWEKLDLYWEGEENEPESDNDPASNTNIINPNVEGQVAYLIEQNLAIETKPRGPSDAAFADVARIILEFVKERNKMRRKLDVHERRRMKFGTGIFRVLFDPDELDGMGMPIIEPCNPAYVFPDPNITDIYKVQEGRFLIEVVNKSISWARESGLYPEDRVDAIMPGYQPLETEYLFGEDDGETDNVSRDHYLHMFVWFRDKLPVRNDEYEAEAVLDDGDNAGEKPKQKYEWRMRLIEMSGDGIILRDTKDEPDFMIPGERYPYFFTPDMYREGTVWAKSTAELLTDTQDLINEIDDQIRINARLTGNPQRWVSAESGVDPDKWTNEGGLTIPTDSQGAAGVGYFTPPSMPQYIIERRNQAFGPERQVQTRFSDQQAGIKQSGVDTATEALALQQGANAGIQHKKMLLEETLSEMFEYILELCMEYWDQEMAFRVTEENSAFEFFRPSDLKEIPMLIPSGEGYKRNFVRQMQFLGMQVDKAPEYMPLEDEMGNPVTKKVGLDISVTVGAGLPTNKAFVYSIIKENAQILPPHVYIKLLKDYVGLPVSEEDLMPPQQPAPAPMGMPMNPDIAGMTPQGAPMMPATNPALGGVM